jgi:antitoxin MazE
MVQVIRKIGNSSGVIIPKTILEQVGIEKEVEMEVVGNTIVLMPYKSHPREGWEGAFQTAIAAGELPENDVMEGVFNEFDNTDWQW